MLACNSMDLIQISNLEENLKVIGPIGSGKTTVLKNIALGLEKVLVFDTCGEYGELEKQVNNVKVVTLTRNETKYSFECELKEEQIKLAEKYKYIIIDEPIHINRDQLIFFLEHMKTTDSKVITTFMPTSCKEFTEDEVTKYFPYVITLTSHFRESEDFEKMIKKIGGISISLPLDNKTINPLDSTQKFEDFINNKNLILIGKCGTGRAWKLKELLLNNVPLYGELKEALQERSSVVINDPKGLLYGEQKDLFEERGYQIEVLNLVNPIDYMSYNPLQLVKDAYGEGDYSTAQALCKTLTYTLYYDANAKDKFWQQCAMSLCNAMILATVDKCIKEGAEEKITLYTVANMLSELGSTEIENEETGELENALDMYFQKLPEDSVAKMQYAISNFSKGTTRGGIFTQTMNGLSIFKFDEIAKMTSENSVDLKRVGFGKTIKGTAKPRECVEIHLPDGSTETVKCDIQGLFELDFKQKIKPGDKVEVLGKESAQRAVVKVVEIDEQTGNTELKVIKTSKQVHIKKLVCFEKPIAIFMITPDFDESNHVLASIFVRQLYYILAKGASLARGGKCHHEVVFILNDFDSMPAIEGIHHILSCCSARNMRFNLIMKEEPGKQLIDKYGENTTSIINNTSTKSSNKMYIPNNPLADFQL